MVMQKRLHVFISGSVQGVFFRAVDEMVQWCYKGSPGSIVKYVDMKKEKAIGLSMFEIK